MDNIKERLSWMNIAGVTLIIYAAASFLIEGWNNLTDLTKFLTYFGFSFLIYLLSEIFKNNEQDKLLSKILWILASFTSLAIIFQTSSFLIDKYNPTEAKNVGNFLSPNTSILVLSFISFAYFNLVKFRLSKFLFGKIDYLFVLIMSLNAIIILLPFRNYYYQLTTFLIMILFSILYHFNNYIKKEEVLEKYILTIAPILVFAARIYLYEQYDSNYIIIISLLGIVSSVAIELQTFNEESFLKESSVLLVFVSLAYLSNNIVYSSGMTSLTFFVIVINFLFLVFRHRILFVFLICFLNFAYAFNFTIQIESHTLVEIVLMVVAAIAYVINGYLVRNKMRFMAYSIITIILLLGIVANSLENIQVNQSIVIAVIGLGLLMVRFIFANPKNKIMEIISTIKERFEDKNNSSLS